MNSNGEKAPDVKNEPRPVCGIVMPISELDGCSEDHWSDVHEILSEAIDDAGFESNLVSNADEVGIIQKTIIQNLYENPVVVCDVSGKNPNVMFELGLRLAFDRPTIIVKDDKTSYTFDTAPIEHVGYPRDLRFSRIVEFKAKLSDKIKKTHEAAMGDVNYTTFLKHFGEFKVAKIDQKEVSGAEFILDELRELRSAVSRLDRSTGLSREPRKAFKSARTADICLATFTKGDSEPIVLAMEDPDVIDVHIRDVGGHDHLKLFLKEGAERLVVKERVNKNLRLMVPRPKKVAAKKRAKTV